MLDPRPRAVGVHIGPLLTVGQRLVALDLIAEAVCLQPELPQLRKKH